MLSKIGIEKRSLLLKVCNERGVFLEWRYVGNLLIVEQSAQRTPKDVGTGGRISKLTAKAINIGRLGLSNDVVCS